MITAGAGSMCNSPGPPHQSGPPHRSGFPHQSDPLPLSSVSVRPMRRLETLLPAATVTLAAMLGLRRLGDSDTWWHLAAGRWIAEHHTIPHTDTLSYTVPDHPWINLQWLFDLFIYALYRTGDTTLVVLAGVVFYAAAAAVLLKNLRLSLGPAVAAVMGLWALAIAQGRFTIRPEMVSFLLLEIVLFLCATGSRTGARRLWLLPAVMLLWVNTHGIFVIGAFCDRLLMLASAATLLPSFPCPVERFHGSIGGTHDAPRGRSRCS